MKLKDAQFLCASSVSLRLGGKSLVDIHGDTEDTGALSLIH